MTFVVLKVEIVANFLFFAEIIKQINYQPIIDSKKYLIINTTLH